MLASDWLMRHQFVTQNFKTFQSEIYSLGPCSQILVLTHDMPKTKGYAVKVTEWQYNLC